MAGEVRNLAQRAAAAAKEIKELIGASAEQINGGSKLVGDAGATMQEIVVSVRRVTDIMGEIMSASQEQSAGIEQVNQAIGQMDRTTQENAALVEQAAAASEALQEQADKLAQVASMFEIGDDGLGEGKGGGQAGQAARASRGSGSPHIEYRQLALATVLE